MNRNLDCPDLFTPPALRQVSDAVTLTALELETQQAHAEARTVLATVRADHRINRWWSLGLLLATVCYAERLTDLSPFVLLLLLAVGLGWWDRRYQTPTRKFDDR